MTIKHCYTCGFHHLVYDELVFCSQECLNAFKEIDSKEKLR
jgi:predicted nucleic acid-binding Zn ribbon protein